MPIVDVQTPEGQRLLVNARGLATSVFFNNDQVLNFDRSGRLTGAWIGGCNYRRSLDNRIVEKREGPLPGLSYRVRRELTPEECREFLMNAYGSIRYLRGCLADQRSLTTNTASASERAEAIGALDRVLECTVPRLEQEAESFRRIFKPVNILPPDQYLALVLQATEGCSYNRCSFCGFYRDRQFRAKSINEFRDHLRAAVSFFGEAINLRQSIFLADANALVIPQEQLIPIFDLINRELPIEPAGLAASEQRQWREENPIHFRGIYSFIDAFTSKRKTAADFKGLAARGLRRVYIGLESGEEDLLRFLGKPNSPQDAINLAHELKAGGVAVGIVVLAGAGGDAFSNRHISATADAINRMSLGAHDLIYFSELVDHPGSRYSELTRNAGIMPLTVPQMQAQIGEIRKRIVPRPKGDAPKTSFYDIREFVY